MLTELFQPLTVGRMGDAADVTSEDGGTILTTIAQAYDRARAI